jgi:hypothetical protein
MTSLIRVAPRLEALHPVPLTVSLPVYMTSPELGVSNVLCVTTYKSDVARHEPGRGRWIFKDDKNPQHDFFRRESKTIGTMPKYFTAC